MATGLGRAMGFIKKIFRSKFCQWLFARIHPNLGIGIANSWSRKSRIVGERDTKKMNLQQEWLVVYSREVLKTTYYDYMVFGHRHYPLDVDLDGKTRYINLGEWVHHFTYAVFDGKEMKLEHF
jgi:UDP-2,3-diacylglucosamine hydrolase